MRFGSKLVAVGAVVSCLAPLPGRATEGTFQVDYVREVEVTADVRHGATGKKGTMSFRMAFAQGIDVTKDPMYEGDPLDNRVDPHAGTMPTLGTPYYTGCLTLVIPTVVTRRDRCYISGVPTLESDPLMEEMTVSAQMAKDSTYQTSVSLTLEANGDLAPDSEATRDAIEPTPEWRGLGYAADIAGFAARPGIVVGGALFDEAVGGIVIINGTEEVAMRVGFAIESFFIRGPVVCSESGIPLIPGAVYQNWPPGGPPPPEQIPVGPNGCQPDDIVAENTPL